MKLYVVLLQRAIDISSHPSLIQKEEFAQVAADPKGALLSHDLLIKVLCEHIELLEKRIKALEDAPPPAELRRY